jgi:exodeoxyribonuclease V alpha subunit
MASIKGRVWSITFNSGEFYVLTMEVNRQRVTCRGSLFGIQTLPMGLSLELTGRWMDHPKYGRQFDISSWYPWAEASSDVELFLRSCLDVPFGRACAVVDTFGVDTFRILSENPSRLLEVPDVDQLAVDQMVASWVRAKSSADLAGFLVDHDLTSGQIRGILNSLGTEAKKLLEENPYRLVDVKEIQFVEADDISRSMGVGPADPRRYEGAVLWVLREATLSGHLCVKRADIASTLKDLSKKAEIDQFDESALVPELIAAVDRLAASGRVHIDPSVGVYLPSSFRFERESARKLAEFLGESSLDISVPEFLTDYETLHQIALSEAQKQAVEKLVVNKVLVLTGLPGTGKTTVVRTVVNLFDRVGVSYALMAPTGIAAKRLAAVTGKDASTIHRAFGYDGESWSYNQANKYPIQAVVVDEVSMVDQELFFRILDALDPSTILVFVGDDAQLPSVGPGNVLRELTRCSDVSTVRLTQIFRQAEKSAIVINSHAVHAGREIDPGKDDSDFRFVSIGDEAKAAGLIVQMSEKLKAKDANFQVLSPKYDGVLGVTNLNNLIREALNPPAMGKREMVVAGQKFREGDRLMVVRNDYRKSVYNGDMGKLMQIGRDHFLVRIHGVGEGGIDMITEFPKEEIAERLKLAYAITVHKCQGSEFDTIILPMVRGHGRMLQRNLFYTAITRARKKVWVLGEYSSITRAIGNDQVVQRGTALAKSISEEVKLGVERRQGST